MSILNVNQIQPVGSGQTVTISATNVDAGSATVTAGTFSGNLSSSGISTFSDTVNVGAGKSIRLYGATSGYSEIIAAAGSASTTFTLPANGGSSGEYLQTNGSGELSWVTPAAAGKVLQVKTAIKTDVFSYTATSFTNVTGLSVDITPSNTNNRIILMASVYVSVRGNVSAPYVAFGKGGSVITNSTGDAAGSRPRVTSSYYGGDYGDNNVIYNTLPMMYAETAGATTQQTYSVMIRQGGAITMYVNRSIIDRDTANYEARGASSLIAMEVAPE